MLLSGCATQNPIVTSAQSVLGISVSQNQTTQMYEARAGIVLSQVAIVPCATNGTACVPVIQEFKVNNLFAGGLVYQRLAVGVDAVSQPGAAAMFAKNSSGVLDPNLLKVLVQSFQTKPKQ